MREYECPGCGVRCFANAEVCPFCGCSMLQVLTCPVCRGEMLEGDGLCRECQAGTQQAFLTFLTPMADVQLTYLEELSDGVYGRELRPRQQGKGDAV